MTLHHSLASFILMAVSSAAFAAQPIPANSMGLSKTSVFDVPEPRVYHYTAAQPGENKLLPRGYPGAPPQVSHDVSEFLPITTQSNMCISCHDQPGLWGKKLEKGMATPIPPTHYTDLRNAPGKVTDHLMGARYNCNQCHVPQADAPALVENTFSSKGKR